MCVFELLLHSIFIRDELLDMSLLLLISVESELKQIQLKVERAYGRTVRVRGKVIGGGRSNPRPRGK